MSLYQTVDCEQCRALNAALAQWIESMPACAVVRRSHHIGGRYENLYVDSAQAPGLQTILDAALNAAAGLLNKPPAALRLGFWLNIMQQGDVTSRHSHDDLDELLSGTYYIQAPPGAAALVLFDGGQATRIAPQAGRFVFFAPHLEHEVEAHQGSTARISLGFNIGLKPA